MIHKELKKLSRRELVDIIYQMKKNEQQMQEEIDSLKHELNEKLIKLSEAGSIAEAAVSITNVFTAAQSTADLYLSEISHMKNSTEEKCEKMIADTNRKVDEILSDGVKKYAALRTQYQKDYRIWKRLRSEIEKLKKSFPNDTDED